MDKKRVLLVGAGPMAEAYVKVLADMNVSISVVCRSEDSAQKFKEKTGYLPVAGGLDQWLKLHATTDVTEAIVATPVEMLHENVVSLLKSGIKKILVEKPGGLNKLQLQNLSALSEKVNAEVFIAYNRRFYESVLQAERIIKEDGGIQSMQFEFTEWSHVIEPLIKGEGVKEKWFLVNSTHVVDMTFFMIGQPDTFHVITGGEGLLNWHPSASRFAGSGVSDKGVIFSYLSDWQAPGRWSIEILTKQHRLYLKPMEQLMIQKKGSVAVQSLELNDVLDKTYKPGLYLMTKAFLGNQFDRLCTLKDQASMMDVYYKMANYTD
jgi:predicted dehydrogenase